jgi:hypothetical protein
MLNEKVFNMIVVGNFLLMLIDIKFVQKRFPMGWLDPDL